MSLVMGASSSLLGCVDPSSLYFSSIVSKVFWLIAGSLSVALYVMKARFLLPV